MMECQIRDVGRSSAGAIGRRSFALNGVVREKSFIGGEEGGLGRVGGVGE
jgi:hypothetical protein